VRVVWLKRTWCCAEPGCEANSSTEVHSQIAKTRALLTVRAVRQVRFEHASVSGLTRQLGVTWRTLSRAMRPLLEAMAADKPRWVCLGNFV
jgi:DNA-binding transcriptional ArsR family regulator